MPSGQTLRYRGETDIRPWHLGPADGEPIVIGFDVAVLDPSGQISSVHGFLDKVPAAA